MLYAKLKQTPRVAGVTVQEAALRSFEDTVAENLLRMRLFNVIFASIIAAGVGLRHGAFRCRSAAGSRPRCASWALRAAKSLPSCWGSWAF